MTTLPISMPYVFANVTTTQRLAYLDSDFATLTNAINGIGNGTVALANVNITGGNVAPTSNSVPLSALQATGTLTNQHYLRGDGTWSGIASPAGGTVTSVNVNGGTTGFTFTGGPIDTSGNITMSGSYTGNVNASQLVGAVSPANGGTGITIPGTSGNVLTSNGSAWVSQSLSIPSSGQLQTVVITSNTTWTVPAGVTEIKMICIGGGGGGGSGGSNGNQFGTAGGHGGFFVGYITNLTPGSSISVTIGTGGSGSTYGGTNYGYSPQQNGTSGTSTIFGSYVTCTGGTVGTYGGGTAAAGTATVGSGATSLVSYLTSYNYIINSVQGFSPSSGSGVYGSNGSGYGAGGGGGDYNSAYNIAQAGGGNGTNGLVIIEYVG